MFQFDKFTSISQSPSVKIADIARKLEKDGKALIKLQTGDPDFPLHSNIRDSIIKSMNNNETHYSSSAGLPELRQVIAKKYSASLSVDNVLICHGAVHAICISIMTIVKKGDGVLIPEPNWTTYDIITKVVEAVPIKIDTRENEFKLSLNLLKKSYNPASKILILNYPSNPSGKMISREELSKIVKWCKKNNIIIISDEVYGSLLFDCDIDYCSIYDVSHGFDNIIVVNSFSKKYAMSGLRIGYLISSKKIIKEILKAQQATITNVAVPIQRGAITALTDSSVQDYAHQMFKTYKKRKTIIKSELDHYEMKYIEPEGAFYFLIRINYDGEIEDFCDKLLRKKNVVVVPGSAYGKSTRQYIRISFASSIEDCKEGIKRISEFLKNI